MYRFRRDVQATIRITLRDATDTPVDADAGVTAAITDSAGIAITGSPFNATHVGDAGSGIYEVALTPAKLAVLDMYDVVWTASIGGVAGNKFYDQYEVVGGFLFTESELRDSDPELNDPDLYTQAAVVSARNAAEDRLENECRVAFRPRGRRARFNGSGKRELLLHAHVGDLYPRAIISAKVDAGDGTFVALTAGEVAALRLSDAGVIVRPLGASWPAGEQNIEIFYEHGLAGPPEPVRRAAMALAKANLVGSALYDRATSVTTADGGVMRQSLAGRDGPTGIPEVDAVIEQFGRARRVIP